MAINNEPTIQPRTVTGIFTNYIAKVLPLAFDDSMSYYECLCALRDYINQYIDNLNNVNAGLAELQEFYLELQSYINNYFDNLDVQEEINNKLDQMALDGSLTSLISAYINPLIDAQNVLINNVSSQYEDLQEQVTTNSNRISSFTTLTEGSTTGDAELIDGRDGFNASTYANIGDAIRGQAENNCDQINEFISQYATDIVNSNIDWEIGSIQNSTGQKTVTSAGIRFKDFIKVNKGSIVKLNNYTGYSFKVFVYSTAEHTGSNVIEETANWQTEPYVITKDGYLKCVIKGSGGAISDPDTVSIYFNAHLFTVNTFASVNDLTLLNNQIDGFNAEIEGISEQFLGTYDISTEHWESGVIYNTGFKGANAASIRTVEFMPCKHGSVVYLNDYSNARFRVLVYAKSVFQTPLEATAWKQEPYIIENDGYLMVTINNPAGTDISGNISDYSSLFNGLILTKEAVPEVYKLPTSWTENIPAYKKAQGTKNAIAVQTDTHYSIINNDNINIANDLKEFTNYFGVDYICNLGDIIQGYETNTLDDMKKSFTEIVHRYVDNCRCPFLYSVGNHDDCSLIPQEGGAHDLDGYILGNEIYANTIPFVNNTGKIVNNKKLYYYEDFEDYRVIVLNTRDIAYQTFSLDDINVNNHKISAEQISWLTNTALNTDKPVIVMCHVPLISSLLPDANAVTNASDVVSALESFVSGGGTIIAVLSGHSHQQNDDKVNGINYITFKNGGMFAEVLLIDIENQTITTKLIGDVPEGIIERSFTF